VLVKNVSPSLLSSLCLVVCDLPGAPVPASIH